MTNVLAKKISTVKGIGEKSFDALEKVQITRVFDLMLRVPKSLVEHEDSPGLGHLETGRHYTVRGKVQETRTSGMGGRRRLESIITDETGRLKVIFFGPAVAFAQKLLKNDAQVTLMGEVKNFLGRSQMVHPKFLSMSPDEMGSKPLSNYSQLGGINSNGFKKMVSSCLGLIKADALLDHLDENLRLALKMSPLKEALLQIHEPQSADAGAWDNRRYCPHFRRLAFEELLAFFVKFNQERQSDKQQAAIAIDEIDSEEAARQLLPFSLTKAQKTAILDILRDMGSTVAMRRLLQGDVGSGKTAVSALIAWPVVKKNLQVAVLAPTEILAEQLFHVYSKFYQDQGYKIALLTANTKTKERKACLAALGTGDIHILVGTHALLSDDVIFKRLGLIIIDEQHRFGVKQRASLLESCLRYQDFSPHLLVMSATPIPRSLALTFYGDLDLSVIDERPPGRLPIHSQIMQGPILPLVERLAERILSTKQKAFIVFPLVEESETLDLKNATDAVNFLHEKFGKDCALLLHGRMKADEKQRVMRLFQEGSAPLLVSTTVVEVGVDVPDATCMVIVHPERFGLAQLHQLRGRVGRKDLKSYCFLVTDLKNSFGPTYRRLHELCQTENGFKLAEIDLENRGPGEILGTKQSGLPNFLIFSYSDFPDLVPMAKEAGKTIAQAGIKPAHQHLFLEATAYFS